MIEQRLMPVIPEYMDKWLKSKPLYLLLEDILIKNNVPTEIDKSFFASGLLLITLSISLNNKLVISCVSI